MKYKKWLTDYKFDNCLAGRQEHGKFLMSYITGEHDGFVLNLNGEWGTGKTEFLKRMYTGLSDKNHPVIYIDAWESDFSEDPLLVVTSELINQLDSMFEVTGSDLDAFKECIGRFAKGAFIAGAGLLSKHVSGEASAGVEFAKCLMSGGAKDYIDALKEGYSEQIDALNKVRKELEAMAESLEQQYKKDLPVVVLVDELDRCRPNYAIEMLEIIKHFFATRNFVFVIATDTPQLCHSIRAVYGAGFSSEQYLKRFFNREARLAKPDLVAFLSKYNFELPENIQTYPTFDRSIGSEQHISIYLQWSTTAFDLALRDLDQVVAKLQACLRVISQNSNRKQIVNVFVLIIAIIEFEKSPQVFNDRGTGSPFKDWKSDDFSLNYYNTDTDAPTSFSSFYALNMKCSIKHILSSSGYGVLNSKREAFGFSEGIAAPKRDLTSGLINNSYDSMTQITRMRQDDIKIWLWEDFKEIVSLAYTIK